MRRTTLALFIGLGAQACAGHLASHTPTRACALQPDLTSFPDGYSVLGHYELTLVATAGPRQGHRTSGALTLDTLPDSIRAVLRRRYTPGQYIGFVEYTIFGRTDIALAQVGAGAGRSGNDPDPYYPPVTMLFEDHPSAGLIEIGSLPPDASQKSPVTSLRASSGSDSLLQGTWVYSPSGATGYFCAKRVSR
jgi:hypothetical protein